MLKLILLGHVLVFTAGASMRSQASGAVYSVGSWFYQVLLDMGVRVPERPPFRPERSHRKYSKSFVKGSETMHSDSHRGRRADVLQSGSTFIPECPTDMHVLVPLPTNVGQNISGFYCDSNAVTMNTFFSQPDRGERCSVTEEQRASIVCLCGDDSVSLYAPCAYVDIGCIVNIASPQLSCDPAAFPGVAPPPNDTVPASQAAPLHSFLPSCLAVEHDAESVAFTVALGCDALIPAPEWPIITPDTVFYLSSPIHNASILAPAAPTSAPGPASGARPAPPARPSGAGSGRPSSAPPSDDAQPGPKTSPHAPPTAPTAGVYVVRSVAWGPQSPAYSGSLAAARLPMGTWALGAHAPQAPDAAPPGAVAPVDGMMTYVALTRGAGRARGVTARHPLASASVVVHAHSFDRPSYRGADASVRLAALASFPLPIAGPDHAMVTVPVPVAPLRDPLVAPGGRAFIEVYVGSAAGTRRGAASYAGARTLTLDLVGWTPPPAASQVLADIGWVVLYVFIALVVVGGVVFCWWSNRRTTIERDEADALAAKYARGSVGALKIRTE